MLPPIPRAGQVPASPRQGTLSPDSSRSMPRAGLGRTSAASGKSARPPEPDRADAAPPEVKTKTRGSHPLPGSGCPVAIPSFREVAVLVPAARPNPTMIYAGHRHFRLKPGKPPRRKARSDSAFAVFRLSAITGAAGPRRPSSRPCRSQTGVPGRRGHTGNHRGRHRHPASAPAAITATTSPSAHAARTSSTTKSFILPFRVSFPP